MGSSRLQGIAEDHLKALMQLALFQKEVQIEFCKLRHEHENSVDTVRAVEIATGVSETALS